MLRDKILNQESGILFYGLTPPKLNTEEARIQEIANRQIERLKGIQLDGLVLYDVQDESSRTTMPRPFPYMATLAPDLYSQHYLNELDVSRIIYKSVGKFNKDSFQEWISQDARNIPYTVFVGSPSKDQEISLSLQDAYQLRKEFGNGNLLGGVTIPERHVKKGDEHRRVFHKMDQGCSFFITQCVYNLDNTKNFISDYYYTSKESNRKMVPIIFTLTPCGSLKTLDFMNWLGIDIPQWLKNDLKNSNDILASSIDICKLIAKELFQYCQDKNIPIGFNIESVAIRKAEIDASIELLKYIRKMIDG